MLQYFGRAMQVVWPEVLLAVFWLIAGLVALFYARSTRRPIFLFGGLTALLLMTEQLLSPARLAYRYLSHKTSCGNTAACKIDLLFGAYKYEWLIDGLAVLVLLAGILLEVSRARKRAARNTAARNGATGVPVAAGGASAAPGAGQYQTPPAAQPMTSYGAPMPAAYNHGAPNAFSNPGTAPTFLPLPDDEQQTFYPRPRPGSGSV